MILRCLWFLNLALCRRRRPIIVSASTRFRVLLLIFVEIQVYRRRVVENEVILTVWRRGYVDVRPLTVYMHNVVDYLPICAC